MKQAILSQPKRIFISLHRRCFKATFCSSNSDDFDIVTSFAVDPTINTKPRSDDIRVQDFADLLERPCYISPDATLQDAMDKIVTMKVSCLLICSYRQSVISGILTVRDVLDKISKAKKLNQTFDELLGSEIKDIITPANRMIYCTPNDTLRQVRLAMRSYRVRHLPVVFNKPDKDNETMVTPSLSGVVTAKSMADYASLLKDGVGGKGIFLDFLEKRRGLPKGTVLNRDRYDANQDVGFSDDEDELLENEDDDESNIDRMDGVRGWNETSNSPGSITKRRKLLDLTFGACLKPHPFKSPNGVSQTRRDYGASELCEDISLSEDAFFAVRLRWPSPGRPNNHASFAGVADGVGSWRAYGVDPREFSHKLMKYAAENIQEAATVDVDSNFVAPPSPLEVLGHAWTKVVSEQTVGSATACIVSLDQRLNQLTYANLGDSGVIVLRHVIPQLRGSATVSTSSNDLALAATFMSQQQLHSFNRPYQLGYDDPAHYPEDKGPPAFEHPLDSNVTGYGVKPGDIVIVATDGLFDNVELDEVCAITAKWEEDWFNGANEGAPSPPGETNEMEDLSQRLCARARELSLDSSIDSPFAVLAKDNGIMWSGGMPDDTTIVALRVVKSVKESLTFAK